MWLWIVPLAITGIVMLANSIRIVEEDERGVVSRLGRFHAVKGPGMQFIVPWTDKMTKISTRIVTVDISTQEVITKDGSSVGVEAVLYFRVVDPAKALLEVENYHGSTTQAAQASLKALVGQAELDDLLAAGEEFSDRLQTQINELAEQWGVEITKVVVKQVQKYAR
jgi:regulator of protease activity HflC (stomatin/prohibitin superfamily)